MNKSETIAIKVGEEEPSARGESKSSRQTDGGIISSY